MTTSVLGQTLTSLYASYGYTRFRMSKFEEYELYAQNKNFLISGNVITFTDTTGQLMALKPDVTLAIVKNTKDDPIGRTKLHYTESVYRVSQKSGRFREIEQTGVECLGDIDALTLCEIVMMAEKSLAAISSDSVLAISDLDLVDHALSLLAIPHEREGDILDCVGEKNLHGIDGILKEEGLPLDNAAFLKGLLSLYGTPSKVLPELKALTESFGASSLYDAFCEVVAPLADSRLVIDFSTLGDLRYYSGIVFRGYVNGIAETVLTGGEYNRLMAKMNKASKAVGFAVYLDLLDGFQKTASAYDFDALLLYDATTAPSRLLSLAEELRRQGLSVSLEKEIPQNRRYQTVYRVKEGVLYADA